MAYLHESSWNSAKIRRKVLAMSCWRPSVQLRRFPITAFWVVVFFCSAVSCVVAQELDAAGQRIEIASAPSAQPIDASLCEVVLKPEAFNGRMIRVRGVVFGFIEGNLLLDTSCSNREETSFGVSAPVRIWLEFRDEPKTNRPVIKIREDKEYKKFLRLLFAKGPTKKGNVYFFDSRKFTVTATVTGRFDHIAQGEGHFGTGAWRSQLVLESVSDVVTRPADPTLFEKPSPLQERLTKHGQVVKGR